MTEWREYYNKTVSKSTSKIVLKFFEVGLPNADRERTAIDLGCGTGNDTIYLLKNRYKVTAVDKESEAINILRNKANKEFKLKYIIDNIENVKLHKASLMVANFSIPFCKKECFEQVWKNIVDGIKENRIFYRKFLWI